MSGVGRPKRSREKEAAALWESGSYRTRKKKEARTIGDLAEEGL